MRDCGPGEVNALVANHEVLAMAQRRGKPQAFRRLIGDPAEAMFNRVPVEKPRGIVVERQHSRVRQSGKRSRVRRVAVNDHARIRALAVHGAVDRPGRGIGCVGAAHHVRIVRIEQHQVCGLYAG